MDFKYIRENCVAGETVFVTRDGFRRVFVGWDNGKIVVSCSEIAVYYGYTEEAIKTWKIEVIE